MSNLRLHTWLGLLLFMAVSLTFLVVGSGILLFRLPQVEAKSLADLRNRSIEAARLLDLYMEGVESQLLPLARYVGGRAADELQAPLDAIIQGSRSFEAVLLVSPEGYVEALGAPPTLEKVAVELRGADLSANPLYKAAREAQAVGDTRPVWSDRYLSPLTGMNTIGVAVPAAGGLVIGELSLARLLQMLEEASRREDVVTLFIDGHGQWLASSDPHPDASGRHFDYAALPMFQAALSGSEWFGPLMFQGRYVYAGGVLAPKLRWVIASHMPAGWGNYDYRMTILLVVGGFSGSLLMGLILAPFWASGMVQPLRSLMHRVKQASGGDYDSPWPPPGRIVELNRLVQDLDRMAKMIKQRGEGLARSEERLRATLENTPSVAVQWYDFTGEVLYWNQASERMYGFSAREAMGVSVLEQPLIFPDAGQSAEFVRSLGGIAASGRPFGPREYPMRRKDGSEIIVLGVIFAIPGDDDRPVFVCMDIDLTERKRVEAALLESEKKLEAIFNASPAPMWVSDTENSYRCITVNVAWERQFGRSLASLVGRNGMEIGMWAKASDRQHFLDILEREGSVNAMEAWLVDGQGKHLLCSISALITTIGKDRLLLMMAEDITERRRIEDEIRSLNEELEERVALRTEELTHANEELEAAVEHLKSTQKQLVQSEKLASLGSLVAGVAHELNTPLGNALTVATTLEDRTREFVAEAEKGLRRSSLKSYVDMVQTSSPLIAGNLHRAAELITSFKQVAVDQTSSRRRKFRLQEVVDEVAMTMQPALKRTAYRIEREVSADVEMDSYPGPLGQVLVNLINNAVLHGFEDREYGTIRIEGRPHGHGQVEIVLRDDGKGIPPERMNRIFDPFFTTRMGRGGTGLGLHIVHSIVTNMLGGGLNVHSQPGAGTEFHILLPIVAPDRSQIS